MSRFCELHTNCCPLYYPTKFGKEALCDFGDFTNDRNTIEQWLFTVDVEYFVCALEDKGLIERLVTTSTILWDRWDAYHYHRGISTWKELRREITKYFLCSEEEWIRFSKCQGFGHISTVCPNKRTITIDQIRRWRKEDTMFQIVPAPKDIVQDTKAAEVTQPPIPTIVEQAVIIAPPEIEAGNHVSIFETSNTRIEVLENIQVVENFVEKEFEVQAPQRNPIVFVHNTYDDPIIIEETNHEDLIVPMEPTLEGFASKPHQTILLHNYFQVLLALHVLLIDSVRRIWMVSWSNKHLRQVFS